MVDPQVGYLMKLAAANREVAQEQRNNPETAMSDFEGVASATWLKLNDDGSGQVEYRGKEYTTLSYGTKSIRKGTKVNMEFRKGFYVTYW